MIDFIDYYKKNSLGMSLEEIAVIHRFILDGSKKEGKEVDSKFLLHSINDSFWLNEEGLKHYAEVLEKEPELNHFYKKDIRKTLAHFFEEYRGMEHKIQKAINHYNGQIKFSGMSIPLESIIAAHLYARDDCDIFSESKFYIQNSFRPYSDIDNDKLEKNVLNEKGILFSFYKIISNPKGQVLYKKKYLPKARREIELFNEMEGKKEDVSYLLVFFGPRKKK
jgi:hypothetical protein